MKVLPVPGALLALLLPLTLVGGDGPQVANPLVPPGVSTATAMGEREPAAFRPEWSWPVRPEPAVLRAFEKPPRTWERGHRGVDLSVGADTSASVLSPADGTVSFAGRVVDRGVLSIDHGGGRVSSFEPVTTRLRKGARVSEGEVVAHLQGAGAGGTPGHCGDPCLHWGVRVDGEYVDPLSFVMDRRPSVLLPMED
ncbi:peptidoglycan DD-metalloendopeptidase family protein [Vibrio cholerae]|nr:peptidoglycan DD-metalloendopeptidase family protein [Vibrio cholerae]